MGCWGVCVSVFLCKTNDARMRVKCYFDNQIDAFMPEESLLTTSDSRKPYSS